MNAIEKIKLIFGILFKKQLNLNPDEMAFRAVYEDLLKEKKLTTVFRPGDRDCNKTRGYCPLQIVEAKVIKNVGADWAMISPKFSDFSTRIQINEISVKKFAELNSEDFEGSSLDIYDIPSLKYHLGIVYNRRIEDFDDESLVTVIKFKYI